MGVREETGGRTLTIWLWVAIAVAALAVGWIAYDLVTTPSVPAEVEAAIDDYIAAWEARDAEAMREITADGTAKFIINEFIADDYDDGTIGVTHAVDDGDVDTIIDGSFPTTEWVVERSGPWTVTGEGPWVVSFPETWIEDFETEQGRLEGIATYIVVEQDGRYLVANHAWLGEAHFLSKG